MTARPGATKSLLRAQEIGLILVIAVLVLIISSFAGTFQDARTGHAVNTFFNPRSLLQVTSDASLFGIMAVGATVVIITGGIDLSVGSIYALAGVFSAMLFRGYSGPMIVPLLFCIGIGLVCGIVNGVMVAALRVHPFIITLGTMWIFRGIAFVVSKAQSISFPDNATDAVKATLGLGPGLYPIPTLAMILVTIGGWIYLSKTTAGRAVYAVGGSEQASRYSGIPIPRVLVGVYTLSGLSAGIAAFIGCAYYGAASCNDATGYELKVIAAAVIGGASLTGGKGAAFGALLGAIIIVLFSQAITYLHLDRNYESIIIGCAVVVAVLLDQWSRKLAASRAR